jgi:hypothetical protein
MNNFSKELAVTRAGYPFFPWIDIPNQITVPLYSKFSRVLSFWATFCFPRKYKGIGEGKKCINRKQKYGWGSPIKLSTTNTILTYNILGWLATSSNHWGCLHNS